MLRRGRRMSHWSEWHWTLYENWNSLPKKRCFSGISRFCGWTTPTAFRKSNAGEWVAPWVSNAKGLKMWVAGRSVYLCVFVIRPPGTAVLDGLMFYRRCFFFATLSPRSLDRSPWNFASWSETIWALQIDFKNSGGSPTKKFGGQKLAKFRSILDHFRLWSRISPERLKISEIGRRYNL